MSRTWDGKPRIVRRRETMTIVISEFGEVAAVDETTEGGLAKVKEAQKQALELANGRGSLTR